MNANAALLLCLSVCISTAKSEALPDSLPAGDEQTVLAALVPRVHSMWSGLLTVDPNNSDNYQQIGYTPTIAAAEGNLSDVLSKTRAILQGNAEYVLSLDLDNEAYRDREFLVDITYEESADADYYLCSLKVQYAPFKSGGKWCLPSSATNSTNFSLSGYTTLKIPGIKSAKAEFYKFNQAWEVSSDDSWEFEVEEGILKISSALLTNRIGVVTLTHTSGETAKYHLVDGRRLTPLILKQVTIVRPTAQHFAGYFAEYRVVPFKGHPNAKVMVRRSTDGSTWVNEAEIMLNANGEGAFADPVVGPMCLYRGFYE